MKCTGDLMCCPINMAIHTSISISLTTYRESFAFWSPSHGSHRQATTSRPCIFRCKTNSFQLHPSHLRPSESLRCSDFGWLDSSNWPSWPWWSQPLYYNRTNWPSMPKGWVLSGTETTFIICCYSILTWLFLSLCSDFVIGML